MTLGPKGRNVVIEQSFGAPKITKDGVTVAKAIEFKDKYHNLGAQLVRQVANKTNDVAGDGTTTSTVLCRAIYSEGCKAVAAGMNPMDLRRGINMAVDAVLADLKGRTKQIESKEEIRNVATISANSDVGVGELIANAMEKVRDEAPRPHSPISSRPSPVAHRPHLPHPHLPRPHSPISIRPSEAPRPQRLICVHLLCLLSRRGSLLAPSLTASSCRALHLHGWHWRPSLSTSPYHVRRPHGSHSACPSLSRAPRVSGRWARRVSSLCRMARRSRMSSKSSRHAAAAAASPNPLCPQPSLPTTLSAINPL